MFPWGGDHGAATGGGGSSKGLGRDLVQGNTRALVKPSQTNNRKKKDVEMELEDDIRPQKHQTLGEITQLFSVPVEAATQPHRQQ